MFRAGDPWNPYDPASLALPQTLDETMRRMQAQTPLVMELLNNPEKMRAFREWERESAEERAPTGETQAEQMMREKREWAERDAKSAKLKEEGNAAFMAGDFKEAYQLYTACICLSDHEPAYSLNRAAVALKLKLYERAIEDASAAMEKGDFQLGKAYFRRGQAQCFLGEWSKAAQDYEMALKHQPNEANVLRGMEELKRLRGLSAEEQATWVSGQGKKRLNEVFDPVEGQRRLDELLGQVPESQESDTVKV
ncbi:TPR-like protein [Mycena albidolilacea]|uniref:TPR-like protein n=1 Tax=Mycena albidolilacea TaxID=1033008 RepID=A0AAD7A3B5_9AGAR|nr:TPR-like protein [Mycena albidolilacea]